MLALTNWFCLGVSNGASGKSTELPIVPNYIAHPQFPHTAHDNFHEERKSCPIQKGIQPHPNVPSYSQQTSPQPTDDGRLVYYCSPVSRVGVVATTDKQLS